MQELTALYEQYEPVRMVGGQIWNERGLVALALEICAEDLGLYDDVEAAPVAA